MNTQQYKTLDYAVIKEMCNVLPVALVVFIDYCKKLNSLKHLVRMIVAESHN